MTNYTSSAAEFSKNTIDVRPARESDATFIVESQLKMAFETENLKLDLATVQKGVAAVFKNPHIGQYFIAEASDLASQGALAKQAACLLTLPEWSDWRNGTVLWIHSVFVAPEFRKLGVYKKMYEHLKAMIMKDEALRGLRLYVDHSNQNAQKVYQNLGMSNEHYQMFEWMKTF